MHAVLTVLEAEIDSSSCQEDTCSMLILVEGVDHVTVIDRQEMRTFDDTTALPTVEDTCGQRNVIHEDLTAPFVGEYGVVKLREL